MATREQLEFNWFEEPREPGTKTASDEPLLPAITPEEPPLATLKTPTYESVPVAPPLPSAIDQCVFGATTEGLHVPDEDEIHAITVDQAVELTTLLADLQSVEDALRTDEDPRTGKIPKTSETRVKLREYLEGEAPRLKSAYADTLGAYADAFGAEAAERIDLWVRKTVADCTIAPTHRYAPSHPWHYYHEGDDAPPVAVDDIEGDMDVGQFIERHLPKNKVKRAARIREMLAQEQQRVEEDKRRYQEIVERGAEALSRYDREIAHTSDAMARATALALKYSHICYGLGRIAWLEREAGAGRLVPLSSDTPRDTPGE